MDKQWYVVNTYSGHESKVKEKLEMRTESMDMQDYIHRIVIPEEKVVEVKDGVTKEKVKKMFPGYILVEMVMTDEAWYVVRNTPGVTGFIIDGPFQGMFGTVDSVDLANQKVMLLVDLFGQETSVEVELSQIENA